MQVLTIELTKIHRDPTQPRTRFSQAALDRLGASIVREGLIQPITVRPHALIAGEYMLIAGERRWRASTSAGLSTIRAIVREDLNQKQVRSIQTVENLHREDLTPIEEAEGFQTLLDEDWSIDEIAVAVGFDPKTVERKLAMLALDPQVKTLVASGEIAESVAQEMTQLDPTRQAKATRRIVDGGLAAARSMAVVKALVSEKLNEDATAGLGFFENLTDEYQDKADELLPRRRQTAVRHRLKRILKDLDAVVGMVWNRREVEVAPWVLKTDPAKLAAQLETYIGFLTRLRKSALVMAERKAMAKGKRGRKS